ncbi:uncharacterized protein [Prorops nasuta]|uniref:uncharacterized protein n=1 Tax=Prorops nasuta TaxID=863751 RepID=UPI0034CF81A3
MTNARRSSLRQSLGLITLPPKFAARRSDRLRGRYLFRAAVRLILLEYKDWLVEKQVVEEEDEKIQIEKKEKKETRALSLEDRSQLLLRQVDRNEEDKTYVLNLFKKLHVFKKYSDELKYSLAGACFYQYFGPDRYLVRQGRSAENLYLIINGELHLSRVETEKYTGNQVEIDMGTITSGDMFGEIALLHNVPRTATAVTKTKVDLLVLTHDDFDDILKGLLLAEWDILQDALLHFNYFKGWDDQAKRECCILSKLKDFEPNEILLGDGVGMVNYVHFIVNGECRLLEHMLIREKCVGNRIKYKLYEEENINENVQERQIHSKTSSRRASHKSRHDEKGGRIDQSIAGTSGRTSIDYTEYLLSLKPISKNLDPDRSSIITTTLVDVVNEWHEITDVAANLMKEPSVTSQSNYTTDIHTIFMQICTFTRGACFGLGEEMRNKRIVSNTHVRCFLIPRYWLMDNNRANIWGRVKTFLNEMYPNKKELYKEFVNNRKWMKYKKNMVRDILKDGRRVPNATTIHDVPYSIRINEGAEASTISC